MFRRVLFFLVAVATACLAQGAAPADVLFIRARLLDGAGNPWRYADVAVKGDRIVFVGDAVRANIHAAETIDLHGTLYLAPGFIDLHTHCAAGLTSPELHENLNYLMQGVTTVMTGNDGNSPWPIGATLDKWQQNGIGTNAMLFVGFGTVREQVLNRDNRAPNTDELRREQELVRQGMREGAFGMSTGLFYVPQSFSKTDEVIALAKVAAESGGIYDSHLRDEDSYTPGGVKGAVAEAIEIGREAHLPIMISHIKALGKGVWGQAPQIISTIDAARAEGINVVANQYPYEASGTAFEAAVLPNWAAEGGRAKMLERFKDPAQRARLLQEIPDLIEKRGGPASLVLIGYKPDPNLRGKSLEEIARMWHVAPAEAVLRILEGGSTSVVSHNMSEADIRDFMKQDWTATGSDGNTAKPGDLVHPRSFGTFAVKIQKYVNDEHVITLPFAVRAATSLPAEIAGLKDRGLVHKGYFADLIVFDLAKVSSPATYINPSQYAQGFLDVMVNGKFAIRDGQPTHVLAGQALRRGQ
jgi:N-acyl-D-aspartate/D-glutamate deacylase